jgi:UPF0716 family protein affecting phage T7 exclusion
MILAPKHLRWLLWAGLGWLGLEVVLFWLAAGTFGFLPTLALMALKGVGGFLLLMRHIRSVIRSLAVNPFHRGLTGIGSSGFAALGALLILLPGFTPALAGLALFSPSVRMGIVKWLRSEKRRSPSEDIVTLDAREWREIAASRPRSKKSAATVTSSKLAP